MITHKIEFGSLLISCFISALVDELVLKIVFTSIAMIVGTTFAFFWERYLKDKFKK